MAERNIAFAQQGQFGTAQEAREILDKAVAALRADRDVALATSTKERAVSATRDLNVFCFRSRMGRALPIRLLFRLERM
jgi:hypothetical protein